MTLLDDWQLSEWAFWECINGNDTQQVRNLITTSISSFNYCRDIKDREEIWSKIKDPFWAYMYCLWVKNRPEVREIYDETIR